MKMMFGTVRDVGEKLVKALEITIETSSDVEIKDIAARFTTDVISSVAFGLECNSLENPKSEFRQKARMAFDNPKYPLWFNQLAFVFRNLARKLHVTLIRREVSDFFMKVVKDTVEYRESNDVRRNDFMHLLIQLKNHGALDGDSTSIGRLTIEEIAAEAFIFWTAGFETSSTAMCYTLFELSQNHVVQDKARDNIRRVLAKHDDLFTYEAMMEMSYLDKCLSGDKMLSVNES